MNDSTTTTIEELIRVDREFEESIKEESRKIIVDFCQKIGNHDFDISKIQHDSIVIVGEDVYDKIGHELWFIKKSKVIPQDQAFVVNQETVERIYKMGIEPYEPWRTE
jgi:hypothetical protein